MKKIVAHLESIGFVPRDDYKQTSRYITYNNGQNEDWLSVGHIGKEYTARHVKVYTQDAIRVSTYKSTRMDDINKWVDTIK